MWRIYIYFFQIPCLPIYTETKSSLSYIKCWPSATVMNSYKVFLRKVMISRLFTGSAILDVLSIACFVVMWVWGREAEPCSFSVGVVGCWEWSWACTAVCLLCVMLSVITAELLWQGLSVDVVGWAVGLDELLGVTLMMPVFIFAYREYPLTTLVTAPERMLSSCRSSCNKRSVQVCLPCVCNMVQYAVCAICTVFCVQYEVCAITVFLYLQYVQYDVCATCTVFCICNMYFCMYNVYSILYVQYVLLYVQCV